MGPCPSPLRPAALLFDTEILLLDNPGAPEDDTPKVLTPHGSTPGGSPPVPGDPTTITGMKFEDVDADGIRDADEVGLSGWTIYLDLDGSDTLTAGDAFTATDVVGHYAFTLLAKRGNVPLRFSIRVVGWITALGSRTGFR